MADAGELASRYRDAIQKVLGLVATIDSDFDVMFKHPDVGTFYFQVDAEKDPEFMRLVFYRFADRESSGLERAQLLEIVNHTNEATKAAKLWIHDGDEGTVSAAIECFLAGPDQMPASELLELIVDRVVASIRWAVDAFREEVESVKR